MKSKRLLIFLLVIIVLSVFAYFKQTGFAIKNELVMAKVIDITDGDTIKVIFDSEDGVSKIRLLGINTPEKKMPLYSEAKNFLMQVNGSFVELEFDKEKKDRYDRYLAYVFYQDKLVNEKILRAGLATKYMYSDLKYKKRIIESENYGKQQEIGLWQRSNDICAECVDIEIYNGADKDDCEPGIEYIKLTNLCNFNCNLNSWTIKDEANHIYRFENILKAESFVILYSGVGEDTKMSLFWQNKGCASIWNDDSDSAFLRDKEGGLVVYESY